MLKQQSAPEVDMDPIDGNPLNFNNFISLFKEIVESKVEDPRGRLVRLIKYTCGEAKELIKNCVNLPSGLGYSNAMKLLYRRYGDPHQLLAAYRREVKEWPQVKAGDAASFRKFFNFLIKCQTASAGMVWNAIDTPDIICMLVSKLPGKLQYSWNKKVYHMRHSSHPREPTLEDLIALVDEETTLVSDPLFSRDGISQYMSAKNTDKNVKHQRVKTYATGKTEEGKENVKQDKKEGNKNICLICNGKHDLELCETYLALPVQDRSKTLFKLKLCYGCLKPISKEHTARNCSSRRTCTVCEKKHPTSLHGFKLKERSGEKDQQKEVQHVLNNSCIEMERLKCNGSSTGSDIISMCVVAVNVRHPDSNKIVSTYALLDSCSQGTFVTDEIINELHLSGVNTTVTVKTLNGENTYDSMIVEGLQVSSLKEDQQTMWLSLPKTYTRNELPVSEEDIPTADKLSKWDYLKHVADEISITESISIGLLIGANCTKALEPIEVVHGKNGGPYAFRTALGWCVVGPISGKNSSSYSSFKISCNRVAVVEAGTENVAKHYFEVKRDVKDDGIKDMLGRMYNADFTESKVECFKENSPNEENVSVEDKRFMKLVNEETKLVEGHYQVPLPFRRKDVTFSTLR